MSECTELHKIDALTRAIIGTVDGKEKGLRPVVENIQTDVQSIKSLFTSVLIAVLSAVLIGAGGFVLSKATVSASIIPEIEFVDGR